MLIAYSIAYAPKASKDTFYEMGNYAILFYFSHVVTIIIVANLVFWLKDIDPRFRDGEDTNFEDIPSLVAHKKRLESTGNNHTERAKAAYFMDHIKDDVKDLALDFKDKASGFANIVSGGLIGARTGSRRRGQSVTSNHSAEANGGSRSNSMDEGHSPTYIHNPSMHFNSHSNSSQGASNNINGGKVSLGVIDEDGEGEENTVHNPVLSNV
jgi:hypothetical protein